MNKSQLPTVAKKILKKLNSCESKDVVLGTQKYRGTKTIVLEYSENSDDIKYKDYSFNIEFNYANSPLPTQEEIEKRLYDFFIRVNN